MNRFVKLCALLRRPSLAASLLRGGVAAGVEHAAALRGIAAPGAAIDVGAHSGQFSLLARCLFPSARLIALEPQPQAADRYERLFAGAAGVRLIRAAAASTAGERDMFIADRDDSSSLLPPGAGQLAAFGSRTAGKIRVRTDRLDALLAPAELIAPVLLKIDVQGAECDVLASAEGILPRVATIYLEGSYASLYDGQALIDEAIAFLRARGFRLRGVFNQAMTAAFGPTQADFLFVRNVEEAP